MLALLESCLEDLPLGGITLQAGDAVPRAGYGWMWGHRGAGYPPVGTSPENGFATN